MRKKSLPHRKGYHRAKYGGKRLIIKTIPVGKTHRKTIKTRIRK